MEKQDLVGVANNSDFLHSLSLKKFSLQFSLFETMETEEYGTCDPSRLSILTVL